MFCPAISFPFSQHRHLVLLLPQEADTDENQGTLTFEEFSVFYKMMSLRRDLYLLLLSYSDKKDHLTVEEFAQFLRVEQKVGKLNTGTGLVLMHSFRISGFIFTACLMHFWVLTNFLLIHY